MISAIHCARCLEYRVYMNDMRLLALMCHRTDDIHRIESLDLTYDLKTAGVLHNIRTVLWNGLDHLMHALKLYSLYCCCL